MDGQRNSVRDEFSQKCLNSPDDISYIAAWMDLGKIQIWGNPGTGLITEINPPPEKFEQTLNDLVQSMLGQGIDLMRLDKGTNLLKNPSSEQRDDYRFFYRPEKIEYFEYTTKSGTDHHSPAIVIEGIPFFMDEKAADLFISELKSSAQSSPSDWLDFSNTSPAPFQSTEGKYGFRKSLIIDMFANSAENLLAIQSKDLYRVFVPIGHPERVIESIAQELPHLVKSDAPETAYPLYYDPDHYPENRRHHVNIILRR
ncbi:MAG: hypothetical protein PHX61_00280 [Alphaproteobacteria bacterium]|nr:hypothetical protein [Alphaproteobacteria bacterium]